MKIFFDSSDINLIRENAPLIDGVTTNPSIIAKSGRSISEVISAICKVISGPVSAEVIATDSKSMIEEGVKLASLAENVCIKLPITKDGLIACKELSSQGYKTNLTLCFSVTQAILAAKMGATFVSPFIGRLDDNHFDGLSLIEDIREVYDIYGFNTEILCASVRNSYHIVECAKLGGDVVTIPPALFDSMYKHKLTDEGLAQFLNDHKSVFG